MIKKTICLLIIYHISFLAGPVFAQKAIVKKIDEYLNFFVKADQFSGVILAAENGRVIYEKAFGPANAEFKIPNQTNTRFGIASITKSMTAVILARLIEERRLLSEDRLSKYIPNFPSGDKITIDMLLNHRSGIPHRVTKPDEEVVPYTAAEMVEKIKKAKPVFEPGTQNLYSSAGYTVLARVLEIASGKTYSQLLQQYVFAPAKMKDSLDFDGEVIIERRAQDYLPDPTGIINAPLKDYSFLIGAGSVFSTGRDIYKFGEAVLDGKYGETVKKYLVGKTDISRSGRTNGHRAFFKIERQKKWGYVLISNLNSGANDLILQSLESILQGKDAIKPFVPNPKIIPNPNKNPAEFAGRYELDGVRDVEVFVKNNSLSMTGDIRLYPVKPDCFFEYRFYGNVCFIRSETGKIKEIEWTLPQSESTWIKR